MKKTIELIDEQHAALVQVIQFLDSHGHSDEPVREAVDKILNHSDDLIRKSDEEIKQAREVLKRYEY
jgi:glutamate-1-semialdehyde aminotransferase